jgi:aminotransferase
MSLLRPGDGVLVPDPGWPTYLKMMAALDLEPVRYPLPHLTPRRSPAQWLEELRRRTSEGVRLMIVNSPNNPSGAVLDAPYLECITRLCSRVPRLVILSDDAYCHMVYDRERYLAPARVPDLAERTLVVRTFSKSHSMAGWRIGYLAGPLELVQKVERLHITMNCCASSIAQEAAAWALVNACDILEETRIRYQVLRDYTVAELNRIGGVRCDVPQGGFYVFPDISFLGVPSQTVCDYLAAREQLFVNPGSIYGTAGEGHVRICFASDHHRLAEMARRFRRFVEGWGCDA